MDAELGTMARKYAVEYIDRHLKGNSYHDLVELAASMQSSPCFTLSAPDRGLPPFAFVFCETLNWFGSAFRSGVVTYYESTPAARQRLMAAALRAFALEEFAHWYERGVADWPNPETRRSLDKWLRDHDKAANAWLHQLARQHRDQLLEMT